MLNTTNHIPFIQVRLAFVLNGVPFEDHRINFADWPAMKPTMPYGQLPILELDNGQIVTQSEAMMRLVAGDLMPSDPLARLAVDEAIGIAGDFDRDWMPCLYISFDPTKYGYPEEFKGTEKCSELIKTMRENFIKNKLPVWLSHYEKLLTAKGNEFICGTKPTLADCVIIPQLRKFQGGFIDHVPNTSLDAYPAITSYIDRFLAIPAVKEYYGK